MATLLSYHTNTKTMLGGTAQRIHKKNDAQNLPKKRRDSAANVYSHVKNEKH